MSDDTPREPNDRALLLLPLLGGVALVLILAWISPTKTTPPETDTPAPDPATSHPSAPISSQQRAEDGAYISQLTDAGVLTSVDVSPIYTYVSVGRRYWELTYKQKAGLAIIMSRYSVGRGGSVDIAFKDGYTDKKVATYVSGAFSLR